jgi:hypothetical protein
VPIGAVHEVVEVNDWADKMRDGPPPKVRTNPYAFIDAEKDAKIGGIK